MGAQGGTARPGRRRGTLAGRAGAPAALVALLVLGGFAAAAVLGVQPPAPRGAQAPAEAFSAARAARHLEQVAAGPHVAGSVANDAVRDYLVGSLDALGWRTEVQDAVGMDPTEPDLPGMARVRNVVALLPGSDPSGRLFLVAHHDSIQVGPGASDDGAGVSALLETARALAAGPPLRNDVVVVLTDAEEACLCGAEAFVGQHPLAADGGVVLNLEARGTGGPVVMFETSAGNAALVDVFGRAAPHPVGTSFAVEVYRILPNDTDFSAFARAGRFTGLDAAYIDGAAAYHTPQDTPERLDRASLQAHGDNTVALARELGDADLAALRTPSAADATYFPVPGLLVRYPGALIWPLVALAALAVVALAWRARRQGLLSWPRALAGLVAALVPLVLAPVAAQALWAALVAVRPGYAEMTDPWRPVPFRLAVLALTAAVLLGWYALLRRRVGPAALAVGALTSLAGLGALLAGLAPGGSYLATLPALAGAVAGLVALSLPSPGARVAVLTAGAAVAVLVLAPSVLLFLPALGLATGGAAAFFSVLLGLAALGVLEPLFPRPQRGRGSGPLRTAAPAATMALLAAALTAVGVAGDPADAEHPLPAQLMYALDTGTQRARWVSTDAAPSGWLTGYVTGREDLSAAFPILGDEALATGPAPAADLQPPEVTTLEDTSEDGRRTLRLRVTPRRPVRLLSLHLRGAGAVLGASVAGRGLPAGRTPDGDGFNVQFHAPPADGVEVTLVLDDAEDAMLRVMDGSDGLTDLPGFRPRPEGVGVAGSHTSELVVVAQDHTLSGR